MVEHFTLVVLMKAMQQRFEVFKYVYIYTIFLTRLKQIANTEHA
jgi:hypothetical protein